MASGGSRYRGSRYRGSRSSRFGDDPVQISSSLERLLVHLRKPSAVAITTIFDRWSVIVGSELAAHSEPVSVNDARLVVRAYDPSAASSLRWLSADILSAINAIGTGTELCELTVERATRPTADPG